LKRSPLIREGDYKCEKTAVAAIAILSAILGLAPQSMKIHREHPLTTHACPGKNVRKLEIIQEVHDLMIERHAGEHPIKPVPQIINSTTNSFN
jgi:hypothetical protein